jgi:hypothetical protein
MINFVIRLSVRTVEVLCDNIGVTTLEDLQTVYNDPAILAELENFMRRLDYLKFIKTKEDTLRLLSNTGWFFSQTDFGRFVLNSLDYFPVADNSGWTSIPSNRSSDSGHTDSGLLSRSLSNDLDLANAIVPYINNPNSSNDPIDPLDALRSPVETSARFAVNVIAVVEGGDQSMEADTTIIPSAEPVVSAVDVHLQQHLRNHHIRVRIPRDPTELKEFLLNPGPMRRLNCYIRRERRMVYHGHPTYTMFTEEGNHFLLSAKKIGGNFIVTSRKLS